MHTDNNPNTASPNTLPTGKHRVRVRMSQHTTQTDDDMIVLDCVVLESNNAPVGAACAIAHVFRMRDEQRVDDDGEIVTVRVPTIGSEYVLARAKAYCLAAIAGDSQGEYESRTEPSVADFELLAADKRAHTVDVTVTETPNKGKNGGTVRQYAWAPVEH